MNNKDLYEILGIQRNASEADIKRAYKKLALRYHPDRQGGKSDAEKKAAEEKFKEVSFAYSILSDPSKKQRYDQFDVTDDSQQMESGFDPSEIFKHFMGGFGSMFDDDGGFGSFFGGHRRQSNTPIKGQSIRMQIPVSIEDLLNGINRDIKYNIDVRCDKCNGTGGDGIETCPHCHGTGMITETRRNGFGIIQNSHPCQYCHGTGQIIKNRCSNCNGTGFKSKEVSVHVNIPAGFDNGYQMLLHGKGYEAKYAGHENGDLLLEFIYNFDANKYGVSGNKIYEKIDLPYYDCILGGKKEVVLPNKEKITIDIPQYTQHQSIINTNKRFGGYTYSYIINVKLPTYIRDKERHLLAELKKENS